MLLKPILGKEVASLKMTCEFRPCHKEKAKRGSTPFAFWEKVLSI